MKPPRVKSVRRKLCIKPGRYRTRGKGTAVITHINEDPVFPVRGIFDGRSGFSWTADGCGSSLPNDATMYDLIFRLPDEKPKPAKRERRTSGHPKCESCGVRIMPHTPMNWDEEGVYWHKKCPSKRKRAGRVQWGVFIPMWDKRYATMLLRSLQQGNGIPVTMEKLIEVRRLPATGAKK